MIFINRLGYVISISILASSGAVMADNLTLYCSAQEDWCQLMARRFEEETGTDVDMIRKSTGEVYAQIRAEASNPKGDVWWGGTGDPHMQAAEEELTAVYVSPMRNELFDWANAAAEDTGNRTIGIFTGTLGFGYNTEIIAESDLPAPACWEDLLDPVYKGHIQMANPNTSGTAYTTLATIVQLFGEEDGFEYLRNLHTNISQYTKSGSAPIKAAAIGENTIGIVFILDAIQEAVSGFPIETVAPCEGTGYGISAMSIIEGGPNPEQAKAFYDWALTAEIQATGIEVNAFQTMANVNAPTSDLVPDPSSMTLIDYDFAKYGSSSERQRLLRKWDEEVAILPH